MASQTTTTTKQGQTIVEPREDQMRERLGFDRRGLRREMFGLQGLDLTDKYIEQEDRTRIDPRTVDMPFGPSEMGETAGTGIELYEEEGDAFQTYRFAHGFTMLQEDLDAAGDGSTSVADQRDEIMEIFDFYADKLAMAGLSDNQGNTLKKGVLQYMQDNVPSARTFNLEDYDNDAGDEDETDNPENVLFHHAFEQVSGNILTQNDLNWDVMVCTQPAYANFNQIQDTSSGAARSTYWQRLNSEDTIGGVDDVLIVPKQMEYPTPDADKPPITVDLTPYLGDNECFLIPDMEFAAQNYWKAYEMDAPEAFPMNQKDGGKMRQDYAWRYQHVFNPKGRDRWANLEDVVHLTNLDVLFN